MGLFNRLGREVEKFKQNATAVAEKYAGYRCEECDAEFDEPHDECPECGSERVVAVSSS